MRPAQSPKVSQRSVDLVRELADRLNNPPKPDYQTLGRRLQELVELEASRSREVKGKHDEN